MTCQREAFERARFGVTLEGSPPQERPLSLRDELEEAVMFAAQCEPMGPLLEGKIRLVARAVLLRHGMKRARIDVRRIGRGLKVDIQLPPRGPTVDRIVLTLGSA